MSTQEFEEKVWNLARECGLLFKQPGTKQFDEALFLFARKLLEQEKANDHS